MEDGMRKISNVSGQGAYCSKIASRSLILVIHPVYPHFLRGSEKT